MRWRAREGEGKGASSRTLTPWYLPQTNTLNFSNHNFLYMSLLSVWEWELGLTWDSDSSSSVVVVACAAVVVAVVGVGVGWGVLGFGFGLGLRLSVTCVVSFAWGLLDPTPNKRGSNEVQPELIHFPSLEKCGDGMKKIREFFWSRGSPVCGTFCIRLRTFFVVRLLLEKHPREISLCLCRTF